MKFDEHAINGIYAKKMTTVSNKLPVCNEKWYNKKTLHKKKKKICCYDHTNGWKRKQVIHFLIKKKEKNVL